MLDTKIAILLMGLAILTGFGSRGATPTYKEAHINPEMPARLQKCRKFWEDK